MYFISNPVRDFVSLPEVLKADQIVMVDLMGKSVYPEFYKSKINLSGILAGIYVIKIISEGKLFQSTFQKI